MTPPIIAPVSSNSDTSDRLVELFLNWSSENRCLHVLRSLRKEQYSQVEIDHLFQSLVLPNFTCCLSVYGASEPDLNIIHFLDSCHKRRFVSFPSCFY